VALCNHVRNVPTTPLPDAIVVEAQSVHRIANVRVADAIATALYAQALRDAHASGLAAPALAFQSGASKMKVVDVVLHSVQRTMALRSTPKAQVARGAVQLVRCPQARSASGAALTSASGSRSKGSVVLAYVARGPAGSVLQATKSAASQAEHCTWWQGSDAAEDSACTVVAELVQSPSVDDAVHPAAPEGHDDEDLWSAADPWAAAPQHSLQAEPAESAALRSHGAHNSTSATRPGAQQVAAAAVGAPARTRATTSSSTYTQNKTASLATLLELLWGTARCNGVDDDSNAVLWHELCALPPAHRHDVADAFLHAVWWAWLHTAALTLPAPRKRRRGT